MRRAREDGASGDFAGRGRKRDRGMKFTFLSFAVVALMMVVMKAINPDLPMRQPVVMFASVFLGCVAMMVIVRRMK